jgi:diguanylate cyclase (GGDEF)-like protein/PAS domain S-box-containing protein
VEGAIDDPHFERWGDAIGLAVARWDRTGRLLACNSPYLAWARLPREQLVGRTLAELYGDAAWAVAAPAFGIAFAGHATSYRRRTTHRDDQPRWLRVQVFPRRDRDGARIDAVYTIAFDVHDDVEQREALYAARQRLDRFADNIPYPLTYVDRDYRLQFVNKAYCAATGSSREALLGRHIGAVRGARRWAEHRPYFERALAGEATQYTRLTELADRGARWMRTSYVPDFDASGHVVGLYTVTIDVHELSVAREQLQRSVERDAVTGAYSRRTVMDRLEAAAARSHEEPMALFFIDLDGFKAVNDALGHREGDSLLAGVAAALQSAVRVEDTVGRFGGDEFLVLARVRDDAGAHALAEHLVDAVRHGGAALPGGRLISASIGYALAPADADQPLKLLQLADDAMYAAKRLGKNRALHCRAMAAAPHGR